MKVPTFLAAISMVNFVVSIALLAPWSSTANGLGSHRRQITPETSNEFIDGGCRDVILFFARGTGAPGNMVRWQLRPHTAEFARRRKNSKVVYIQCKLIPECRDFNHDDSYQTRSNPPWATQRSPPKEYRIRLLQQAISTLEDRIPMTQPSM